MMHKSNWGWSESIIEKGTGPVSSLMALETMLKIWIFMTTMENHWNIFAIVIKSSELFLRDHSGCNIEKCLVRWQVDASECI